MKVLVIRLSSLGDVILATAFLENLPTGVEVDWVIAREFAFVLKGHPRIRKLWVYDKRSGLRGWLDLCRQLHAEDYSVRIDLHRTLRSRLAFGWFRLRDLSGSGTPVRHLSVSKQRLRNSALLLLKGACPQSWLPEPYWKRFAGIATRVASRIDGTATPSLNPPSCSALLPPSGREEEVLSRYGLQTKRFVAVMPASRWSSKEWSVAGYVEVLSALFQKHGWTSLVVGRKTDQPCVELVQRLKVAGVPVAEALEEPDFGNTAVLLKHSVSYLGSDTGLAHLAEAVGTPSRVIFGPTRPELGFGPWRPESLAVSLPVVCAPCSKDGRHCYRIADPYKCMRGLGAERVEATFR